MLTGHVHRCSCYDLVGWERSSSLRQHATLDAAASVGQNQGRLQGHEHSFNMTNVEYTEFDRLGIQDEGESETGISLFPANTNVLYIGLQVLHTPPPGLGCSCDLRASPEPEVSGGQLPAAYAEDPGT